MAKQKNNPLNNQINELIQSQNQLSYKDVQTKLLKTTIYNLASPLTTMESFKISPELEKPPLTNKTTPFDLNYSSGNLKISKLN